MQVRQDEHQNPQGPGVCRKSLYKWQVSWRMSTLSSHNGGFHSHDEAQWNCSVSNSPLADSRLQCYIIWFSVDLTCWSITADGSGRSQLKKLLSPFCKRCATASSSHSRGRQIIQALCGAILTVRLIIPTSRSYSGWTRSKRSGDSISKYSDFTRGGNYSAVTIGEFCERGRRLVLLQSGVSGHSGAISLASGKIISHRCCEWALLIGGLFLGR